MQTDASLRVERARHRSPCSLARSVLARAKQLHAERQAHEEVLSSEREETDRGLSSERALPDRAVASRDEFLGIVSRDLRGMLHIVVSQAELIALDETRKTPSAGKIVIHLEQADDERRTDMG